MGRNTRAVVGAGRAPGPTNDGSTGSSRPSCQSQPITRRSGRLTIKTSRTVKTRMSLSQTTRRRQKSNNIFHAKEIVQAAPSKGRGSQCERGAGKSCRNSCKYGRRSDVSREALPRISGAPQGNSNFISASKGKAHILLGSKAARMSHKEIHAMTYANMGAHILL